jgi:hypothetical protein
MVLIVAVKIGREVVKRGGQNRQVTFRMPDGRVTWQIVFEDGEAKVRPWKLSQALREISGSDSTGRC